MLVYNLPLCLLVFVGLAALDLLLFVGLLLLGFFNIGGFVLGAFLYLLVMPIEIGVLSNIYIKKLHEQSELYFKQP